MADVLVVPTLRLICEEAVDLGDSSVERNNGETMVGHVQDQILAHDRKANETEITTGFGLRRADLEASQSRTKVSILIVNRGNHQGKVCYGGKTLDQKRGFWWRWTHTGPDILAVD